MTETKIPAEYLAFDYGFSAVDDPSESTQATSVPQEASPEVQEKLEDILDKIATLTRAVYNLQETTDENISEAELRDKLRQLEAIIIPLLNNLLKTADKPYIYWPNRKDIIETQIKKVLEITRG